jgi:hypothetical protein
MQAEEDEDEDEDEDEKVFKIPLILTKSGRKRSIPFTLRVRTS